MGRDFHYKFFDSMEDYENAKNQKGHISHDDLEWDETVRNSGGINAFYSEDAWTFEEMKEKLNEAIKEYQDYEKEIDNKRYLCKEYEKMEIEDPDTYDCHYFFLHDKEKEDLNDMEAYPKPHEYLNTIAVISRYLGEFYSHRKYNEETGIYDYGVLYIEYD